MPGGTSGSRMSLVPTPRDTEILIRIEAAAICGTDVDEVRLGPITVPVEPHPVNGRMAPMTLGHETGRRRLRGRGRVHARPGDAGRALAVATVRAVSRLHHGAR